MNRYPAILASEDDFLSIQFPDLPIAHIALNWVKGVLSDEFYAVIDKHDGIYVKVRASRLNHDLINFDVLYPQYVTGADIVNRCISIPAHDLKAVIEDGKPKHIRAA